MYEKTQIVYDNVEVNSLGTNKAIKAHILDDEKMRDIGFTDYCKDKWYFCRDITEDVSFNVIIPKDGSDIEIITLDEDFGQPYDFQSIIENNPAFEYALKVKEGTYQLMEYLQNNGVLSDWQPGVYI